MKADILAYMPERVKPAYRRWLRWRLERILNPLEVMGLYVREGERLDDEG